MKAKIKQVVSWDKIENNDCVKVFDVDYSTGTSKRFYSSYTQSIPKTVELFINSHTAKKLNSQCLCYEEN